MLLRAGALPAPLNVVEERSVGAELGADSIRAGAIASVVAAVLVVGLMLVYYGIFGVIADVALVLNVVLILGIMSLLGATLTLPGIAGIVLTIGQAVDSNVLIYERIREEVRSRANAAVGDQYRLRRGDAHHRRRQPDLADRGLGPVPVRLRPGQGVRRDAGAGRRSPTCSPPSISAASWSRSGTIAPGPSALPL